MVLRKKKLYVSSFSDSLVLIGGTHHFFWLVPYIIENPPIPSTMEIFLFKTHPHNIYLIAASCIYSLKFSSFLSGGRNFFFIFLLLLFWEYVESEMNDIVNI